MTTRVPLTQIAPTAWEHPADRAALNALRRIPGFDDVIRRVAAAIGDRGLRHLFLADAVRVGPTQRPQLHALWTEVLESLDWPTRPELYVTQSPSVNAGAVGFGEPFVVINSGTLELLSPDEQRFVLAHELGHIMSGHVVYRTIANIILMVGLSALPFLATVALLPFQIALLEWYRKSELSSDRAALLATQDRTAAMMGFLKLAGGKEYGDTLDMETFVQQAKEYAIDDTAWDAVLKAINTALRQHPFRTVRAGELERWIESGDYARIVAGEYPRRGTAEAQRPYAEDFGDAADYYKEKARDAGAQLQDMASRAKDAFTEAFRSATR
ncbi:MAG: M48 family metallopeptidase [Gemmatimonadaceae bacterium]|nr:M48 family metallopeptidase [Gemmatimonadaceae bacterium]